MIKKINSEYSIKNDDLINIKIGTSDKKNPEVIYTALSTYIVPLNEDIDEETISEFDNLLKKHIKNLIKTDNLCTKDIIVVVDAAVGRMSCGKQTFLEIQIYFKPSELTLKQYNKKFKDISTEIYKHYIINIISFIKNKLIEEDLTLSKIKSKTIYR